MTRPHVVLAMVPYFTGDLFDDALWARLERVADVAQREPLTAFGDAGAAAQLAPADVLLTGWGCPPLDGSALALAPRLRAIVHAAGTVKAHVTEACWARNLAISSAAAANAIPVAEYTVAAILMANKRLLHLSQRYRAVRQFRWWPAEAPGLGNYRKVVGLIGASAVGRAVIERLRPFDLQVVVADPYLDDAAAQQLGVERLALDALLARADIVSLHAPALPETYQLLDARRLALLRDGATLINTARGSLVDHDALQRELVSGRIDAFLDTTEPEVLPADSPLYDLPNVFLTPHVAGAMGTETRRLGALAVGEIERFARGEPFRHAVTRADLPRLA
jgi:phosphoglycerate dehydrogenase-like enzyme